MIITDIQLARLFEQTWKPAPGEYRAPAAIAILDGCTVTCAATGTPLDPAAAVLSPILATALQALQDIPMPPHEPTIAALEANYDAATAPLQSTYGSIAAAATFTARLDHGCRQCAQWKETDRDGRGRCNSVRCACSRRLLWLASETCPESKWP